MQKIKALKCKECSREFPAKALHVCDFCFGPLEVVYDYDAIRKSVSRRSIEQCPASLWRYWDFLPVESKNVLTLHEGFTPLRKSVNLGPMLGLKSLYIKSDAVNPTFSFKDRVVTVALTRARELGFNTVACASTGNLAGAVSAYAAVGGFERFVFIPADLEENKVLGAAIYDPRIVAVQGNYDEVNRLCSEIADLYRWAFVNVNIRPYYAEGSKTLGFEVAEQLGWKAPDHCVVPAASGSLLTKIYKGLQEFMKVGLISEHQTRVHCAQPAGCSPIASAIQDKSDIIKPIKPKTIAKSLAIGNPADGIYASQVVASTGGWADVASDEEIAGGIQLLARTEGIFTETAGGVTVAVLKKLVESGRIGADEVVVVFITGNGYKTLEAISSRVRKPHTIPASLPSFQKLYDSIQEEDVHVGKSQNTRSPA